MTYRTRQGDTVDAICWRYYGRESASEAVLEANRGLAGHGPILPAGLEIELPDLAMPAPASTLIKLWD
ncbi:MAG: phage tail protein [Magnetospirillum sp.]|nr:MAG: phage tail protein [Magnetospirillum sp.]